MPVQPGEESKQRNLLMFRSILDLGISLSQQVLGTFLATGLVFVLLKRMRNWPHPGPERLNAALRWFGLLMVAIFCAVGYWYVRNPGFAGEVEPLVSSLSWVWQQGMPLYHGLDAPYQYSILYGPSVFLTNGLFLRFLGPTLLSAKMASFLGAVASLLFIYASLAGQRRRWLASAAVLAAVLLYWAHGFGIYLVRPDALLVFATGMGIYLAARSRPLPGAVGLAALLGFAVNLKIHGGLYFIPILYLASTRWDRKWVLAAGLGAAPLVLAPFLLFPTISLGNYLHWLQEACHHGLVTTDLPLTMRFAFLLLLPWLVLFMAAPDKGALLRRERGQLLAIVGALLPILVIAAKPGAGPVHLLPLVPIMVVLPGLAAGRLSSASAAGAGLPFLDRSAWTAAACATLLLAGTVSGYRSTRLVAWELTNSSAVAREIHEIMDTHPGLTIGMACGGENESFRETWIRPLLAFAQQPVLVDPISVMDRCRAGLPLAPATSAALTSGEVRLWLVPRGQQPFVKANWYPPHEQIFPASFRAAFTDTYAKGGHTDHFDLWYWKGAGAGRSGIDFVSAGGDNTGVMAPRK